MDVFEDGVLEFDVFPWADDTAAGVRGLHPFSGKTKNVLKSEQKIRLQMRHIKHGEKQTKKNVWHNGNVALMLMEK